MNLATDFIPLLDRYRTACQALGIEPVEWAGWHNDGHGEGWQSNRLAFAAGTLIRLQPDDAEPIDLAAARDMMAEVMDNESLVVKGKTVYRIWWSEGYDEAIEESRHDTRNAALLAGFRLAVEELERRVKETTCES